MALEVGLFDDSSFGDSVGSERKVADILEVGEKSLSSSTLGSFNKNAQRLEVSILTTDEGGNVDDLPVYCSAFRCDDTHN
jgi:hypothetical protein